MSTTRRRIGRTVLISLLLSATGLLIVVLGRGQPADLVGVLRIRPGALAIATALLLTSYLAGASRLFLLARLLGARVRFADALRAYLLGLFSAAATPGGGGHAVAIGLVLRRAGLPSATAWSVAVYPNAVDLLFFAWALPVALLIVGSTPELGKPWHAWAALPVGAVALGAWYLLALRLQHAERLVARVFSLRPLRRRRRQAWRFTRKFAQGTLTLSRTRLAWHLVLQAATLVLHVAVNLILYVVAASLGAPIALLPTLSLVLLVTALATVVPTPGGSGFLEVTLGLVLTRQAAPTEVAPALLAWRAFSHYASLLLGPAAAGSLAFADTRRALERAPDHEPSRKRRAEV